MNENEFATGSVPVMVAARIYGKDASWVTDLIVKEIEPAMALSFYSRLDTVRRLP